MDPTTSFVMALVAAIVAGLSAVAAFLALGQTARYHPAPFFVGSVSGSEPEGEAFHFSVVNMGQASAHDVHLHLRGPGGIEEVWNKLELEVTDPQGVWVSTITGSSNFDTAWDEAKKQYAQDGEPQVMTIYLELTWRQWPAMKRRRVMRWRVKTSELGSAHLHEGRERGALTTAFVEIWQGIRDAFSQLWEALKRLF